MQVLALFFAVDAQNSGTQNTFAKKVHVRSSKWRAFVLKRSARLVFNRTADLLTERLKHYIHWYSSTKNCIKLR